MDEFTVKLILPLVHVLSFRHVLKNTKNHIFVPQTYINVFLKWIRFSPSFFSLKFWTIFQRNWQKEIKNNIYGVWYTPRPDNWLSILSHQQLIWLVTVFHHLQRNITYTFNDHNGPPHEILVLSRHLMRTCFKYPHADVSSSGPKFSRSWAYAQTHRDLHWCDKYQNIMHMLKCIWAATWYFQQYSMCDQQVDWPSHNDHSCWLGT